MLSDTQQGWASTRTKRQPWGQLTMNGATCARPTDATSVTATLLAPHAPGHHHDPPPTIRDTQKVHSCLSHSVVKVQFSKPGRAVASCGPQEQTHDGLSPALDPTSPMLCPHTPPDTNLRTALPAQMGVLPADSPRHWSWPCVWRGDLTEAGLCQARCLRAFCGIGAGGTVCGP